MFILKIRHRFAQNT